MAEISIRASLRSSPETRTPVEVGYDFLKNSRRTAAVPFSSPCREEIIRLYDVVACAVDRVQQLLEFAEDLARLLYNVARRSDLAIVVSSRRAGQPDHVADAKGRHVCV